MHDMHAVMRLTDAVPCTLCHQLHGVLSAMPVSCKGAVAGAFGCTISGAGPTCVAVVDNPQLGQTVAEAMVKAFEQEGKLEVNSARVVRLDQQGARTL